MKIIFKFKLIHFLTGLYFHIPIISFYLLSNHISLSAIFISQVFYALGMLLFEVPLGIFADQKGHQKAIQLAYALDALAIFGLIFFPTLSFLYISYFVRGIAGAANSGSIETMIYNADEKKFTKNLSSCFALEEIGSILAFIIAGVIYYYFDALSFKALLLMTCLAQMCNYLISLSLPKVQSCKAIETGIHSLKIFKNSKQLIHQNPIIKHILILSLCSLPLQQILEFAYPIQMKSAQVNNFFIGSAISISLGLYIIFIHNIHKFDKFNIQTLTICKNIFYASLLFIFALSQNPYFSFLSFILLFSIKDILSPLYKNSINKLSDNSNRATVMSLISLYKYIGLIIMRLTMGLVVFYSSNSIGLVSLASYALLGIIIIWISQNSIKLPNLNLHKKIKP